MLAGNAERAADGARGDLFKYEGGRHAVGESREGDGSDRDMNVLGSSCKPGRLGALGFLEVSRVMYY